MNASEKTFGSPTVSQSTTGLCLKQMCENLWTYQSANLIRAQSTKRWRCQIALKPNRTVFICLDGKFRLQPVEFRILVFARPWSIPAPSVQQRISWKGCLTKVNVPREDRGFGPMRSEERRVGKECRSRWSP